MIFYSWTALSESDSVVPSESSSVTLGDSRSAALGDSGRDALGGRDPGSAGSPVAMGITDDRGRAMAAITLTPCYVRTGVGWLGRYTDAGEVAWKRFFLQGDPGDQQAAGRMGP